MFQVVKGGIGSIFFHPIGSTADIPGTVIAFVWGLYDPYHLLPEPE